MEATWNASKLDQTDCTVSDGSHLLCCYDSVDTCDIAWIDKDDYQEFLKTVGETDRIKSREFILKVFPTSSVIEEESLEFLLNHCVYQEYPPGTVSVSIIKMVCCCILSTQKGEEN